jgi:hypothetical protein
VNVRNSRNPCTVSQKPGLKRSNDPNAAIT